MNWFKNHLWSILFPVSVALGTLIATDWAFDFVFANFGGICCLFMIIPGRIFDNELRKRREKEEQEWASQNESHTSKCKSCGKEGYYVHVDENGLCQSCAEAEAAKVFCTSCGAVNSKQSEKCWACQVDMYTGKAVPATIVQKTTTEDHKPLAKENVKLPWEVAHAKSEECRDAGDYQGQTHSLLLALSLHRNSAALWFETCLTLAMHGHNIEASEIVSMAKQHPYYFKMGDPAEYTFFVDTINRADALVSDLSSDESEPWYELSDDSYQLIDKIMFTRYDYQQWQLDAISKQQDYGTQPSALPAVSYRSSPKIERMDDVIRDVRLLLGSGVSSDASTDELSKKLTLLLNYAWANFQNTQNNKEDHEMFKYVVKQCIDIMERIKQAGGTMDIKDEKSQKTLELAKEMTADARPPKRFFMASQNYYGHTVFDSNVTPDGYQEYINLPKHPIMKKKTLDIARFVALDFETTGLSYCYDRIIEIGAARFEDGIIVDKYSALVDPKCLIPPDSTAIHGITTFDIMTAKCIESELPALIEFIRNDPIVCHNAAFDMKFLLYNANANGYRINNEVICTLTLSKRWVAVSNKKLGTLLEHYGIQNQNAHRALDDAMATGELLIAMLNEQKAKSIEHQPEVSPS